MTRHRKHQRALAYMSFKGFDLERIEHQYFFNPNANVCKITKSGTGYVFEYPDGYGAFTPRQLAGFVEYLNAKVQGEREEKMMRDMQCLRKRTYPKGAN